MEEIQSEIDKTLDDLYANFTSIKGKYSEPNKLSRYDYVWLVFAGNIYFQTKDLLLITKDHQTKTEKIKTSIYSIFRSILEDYFYLKLLTFDKSKIDTHLKALIASSELNNKKNLQSLLNLEAVGKYIGTPADANTVTSLEGLKRKIAEYQENIKSIENTGSEAKRLINIYAHTIQVCEEYDKLSGITKIKEGEEHKSLEWLYGFIFRFTSGTVHQVLNSKESILDLLWFGKTYTAENKEVLGLLLVILNDVKTLYDM